MRQFEHNSSTNRMQTPVAQTKDKSPADAEAQKKTRTAEIRVGPAGWSYADWAGIVYPSHRERGFHEATYLAEFFDTIEINTSFYQPLRATMSAQWIDRVAKNPRFLFTAKLWQKFTHESGPHVPGAAAASKDDENLVREGFAPLADAKKLGAVLLQFPFSFHHTPETVAYLKQLLDRFADYPLVVEVRHSTWNDKEFFAMLHSRGVGFCNIDQPVIGRSMKPTERSTGRVGYIRLHGRRYDTWFTDDPLVPPEERYNYLYSEEELEPWAARVRHVAQHSGSTFVITNNHFQGKGIVNALQLVNLLTEKKVKVPEPLRVAYPQLEKIASEPPREPLLFPTAPSTEK
jgi:uncharacterized protein YecE (DUF72 family)